MGKKKLGYQGEYIVKIWYEDKGYRHIFSNFTIADGEIDLIFVWKTTIVFVEVKVVDAVSDIYDYVRYRKKYALQKAIRTYLYRNSHYQDYDVRLDVVFVKHGKIWESFLDISV